MQKRQLRFAPGLGTWLTSAPAADEFRHQLAPGFVADFPMAGQNDLGSGDSESPAERHHAFADLDFTRAGVARAQDNQFRPLQVQQRSFQAREQAVFGDGVRDLQRVVRACERNATSDKRVFPIVPWWRETPSSGEMVWPR
jgi:hypothetical protein